MKEVNVAVIGTGAWGKNHARVFYELENAHLVAVCDINEERAKSIATKYNAEYFTNFEDILKRADIEAVSIATPTTTHYSIVEKALDYNKKVLVEKPIASTIEEAKKIANRIKKENHFLMVGFISRFDPSLSLVKEIIRSGKIGKIVHLYARRVGPFWPERVGDIGVIKDVALHDIDLFRYYIDSNPISVYTIAGSLRHKYEDYASIIMKFENDISAIIEANWITPHKKREINVTGANGILLVDIMTQEVQLESEQWIMKSKTHWKEPLKLELAAFINAIINDKDPPVTATDGLIALAIAEAALQSSREGFPVRTDKLIREILNSK